MCSLSISVKHGESLCQRISFSPDRLSFLADAALFSDRISQAQVQVKDGGKLFTFLADLVKNFQISKIYHIEEK